MVRRTTYIHIDAHSTKICQITERVNDAAHQHLYLSRALEYNGGPGASVDNRKPHRACPSLHWWSPHKWLRDKEQLRRRPPLCHSRVCDRYKLCTGGFVLMCIWFHKCLNRAHHISGEVVTHGSSFSEISRNGLVRRIAFL